MIMSPVLTTRVDVGLGRDALRASYVPGHRLVTEGGNASEEGQESAKVLINTPKQRLPTVASGSLSVVYRRFTHGHGVLNR